MRLSVALLRNVEAEMRAKERAEAPTVKTKEQTEREEELKAKHGVSSARDATHANQTTGAHSHAAGAAKDAKAAGGSTLQSIWRRKFRPLPEAKAVDLFADVVGDAFILLVATALVIYEWYRAAQKPDANLERIQQLRSELEALKEKDDEREAERTRQHQEVTATIETLRESLRQAEARKPLIAIGTR